MKNHNYISFVILFIAALLTNDYASAQHCPPITEFYLSQSSVKRTKDGLEFDFSYSKTGGQPKASYQAYVLAYSVANSEKIANLTPQNAIKDGLATIVHTQIASFAVNPNAPRALQQTDELGEYHVKYELNTKQFVEKMLAAKQIEKATNPGEWKSFDDDLQLALFIPFLDDKKSLIPNTCTRSP